MTVRSKLKSLILVMYLPIQKKGEEYNSFDGTWKMVIKVLNLLLYSNTDCTPQSHRVMACEDFLKLIEKIKHFFQFLIIFHSPALSAAHSVWSFKLCVHNSPLSPFGGEFNKVRQVLMCLLNGVKRSCPAQLFTTTGSL